jgi:hypothetical protein
MKDLFSANGINSDKEDTKHPIRLQGIADRTPTGKEATINSSFVMGIDIADCILVVECMVFNSTVAAHLGSFEQDIDMGEGITLGIIMVGDKTINGAGINQEFIVAGTKVMVDIISFTGIVDSGHHTKDKVNSLKKEVARLVTDRLLGLAIKMLIIQVGEWVKLIKLLIILVEFEIRIKNWRRAH